MKEIAVVPAATLPFRHEEAVNKVIGNKRFAQEGEETIDWTDCQLRRRYPSWNDFMDEIYQERVAAKRERREAHKAARAPKGRQQAARRAAPWEEGPSAADVHKAYGTTDRGR